MFDQPDQIGVFPFGADVLRHVTGNIVVTGDGHIGGYVTASLKNPETLPQDHLRGKEPALLPL